MEGKLKGALCYNFLRNKGEPVGEAAALENSGKKFAPEKPMPEEVRIRGLPSC